MKVLKIIAGSLVLAGAVALALCFILIPEQTKAAMDVTIGWLNTPLPIAGLSIITISLTIIKLFGMTSIGQRQINKIKQQCSIVINDAKEMKNDLINYKDAIDVKVQSIEKESKDKITVLYKEFDDFTNNVFTGLEQIPNKKVQEYVAEYKVAFEEKKKSIELEVTDANEYVEELKQEYESKYEELLAKVEEVLNERKETVDNQATEE